MNGRRRRRGSAAMKYRTLGKTLADFRAVIPLPWMIGGARILPRVVEG